MSVIDSGPKKFNDRDHNIVDKYETMLTLPDYAASSLT